MLEFLDSNNKTMDPFSIPINNCTEIALCDRDMDATRVMLFT